MGGTPLRDVFLEREAEMRGPFESPNPVQKFHVACGIYINEEMPVVFTHNDLVAVNIIISAGPKPRVLAIIDWGQAGWYPAYWEYCKARQVGFAHHAFGLDLQEQWRSKYLPMIMCGEDDSIWHAFRYFVLANI